LQFGFVTFWHKNIGAKAARKMLVKLATGRSLIPTGRNDGPLYFCGLTKFVDAVKLYRDEDDPDMAHIINVFIYRNDVDQTVEEEEALTRKRHLQVSSSSYQKKIHFLFENE